MSESEAGNRGWLDRLFGLSWLNLPTFLWLGKRHIVLQLSFALVFVPAMLVIAILSLPLAFVLTIYRRGRISIKAIKRYTTTGRSRSLRIISIASVLILWLAVFTLGIMVFSMMLVSIITVFPGSSPFLAALFVFFLVISFVLFRSGDLKIANISRATSWRRELKAYRQKLDDKKDPQHLVYRFCIPGRSVWSVWSGAFFFSSLCFCVLWVSIFANHFWPGVFFLPSEDRQFSDWMRLLGDQVLHIMPVDILSPVLPSLRSGKLVPTSPWGELLLVINQVVLLGGTGVALYYCYWHYRVRLAFETEDAQMASAGRVEHTFQETMNIGKDESLDAQIDRLIEPVDSMLKQGDIEGAVALLLKGEAVANDNDRPDLALTYLALAGYTELNERSSEAAQTLFERMREMARQHREFSKEVEAALGLALVAEVDENYDEMMEILRPAEWVARVRLGDPRLLIEILNMECYVLSEEEDWAALDRQARQMEQLSLKANDTEELETALTWRGLCHLGREEYGECLEVQKRLESCLKKANNGPDLSSCRHQMGLCLLMQEHFEDARNLVRKALEETNTDWTDEYETLNDLAILIDAADPEDATG